MERLFLSTALPAGVRLLLCTGDLAIQQASIRALLGRRGGSFAGGGRRARRARPFAVCVSASTSSRRRPRRASRCVDSGYVDVPREDTAQLYATGRESSMRERDLATRLHWNLCAAGP